MGAKSNVYSKTGGRRVFSSDEIIAAIHATHGLVYKAAEIVGCSHNTIYNHISKSRKVREALESERGKLIDLAENKLYDALLRGEPWAVQMTLKTIGKDRGYTERHEITGVDGGPMHHLVGHDVENMNDEQLRGYAGSLSKALDTLSAE